MIIGIPMYHWKSIIDFFFGTTKIPHVAGEIRHGVADPAEFVPGLRDAVATALLPRGPAELDQFRRSHVCGMP